MRIGKFVAIATISTIMMTGLAAAQGAGAAGTPDAQGGAVGRDQPSSLNGSGVRASAGLTKPRMMTKHHRRHHRRHHM